jgi:hypothetical protein
MKNNGYKPRMISKTCAYIWMIAMGLELLF